MGLKQYVINLATKTAIQAVDAELLKLIQQMQTQNGVGVGTVEKVKGPNQFTVRTNGQLQDITYIGNRPINSNGQMFIQGSYGR